jgi:4-amino-4-deoxychorismate mutase
MTSTPGGDDLESLRARLDTIDHKLLDVLRERIACCAEIAYCKRENAVPMMQPHRIGVVQERAARYASEHGLSAPFLRELYGLVIGETCRIEDIIINASAVPVERPALVVLVVDRAYLLAVLARGLHDRGAVILGVALGAA